MSKIDSLIENIKSTGKNPTKAELWDFVEESLKQIGDINEIYKKIYEGVEEKPPLFQDIEEKYNKIKTSYDNLFSNIEGSKTVSQELTEKIEEIKLYHEELLDGESSIKDDIEHSKKYIIEFYNYLFGESGVEEKTKNSINKINEYADKLFDDSDGIKAEIDKAYDNILEKYNELFEAEEEETSIVDELDQTIKKINSFEQNLDENIKPNLDKQQQYIEEIRGDMEVKRGEIGSLLSDATIKTLAQGYTESMEEYSRKKELRYKHLSTKKLSAIDLGYNIYVFFFNNLFRNSSVFIDYCIFILPLVAICLIMIEPDHIKEILNISYKDNIFSGTEFIIFKSAISIPLLWIAWFGQKNISQKKRLFEEYNHKLRVVQMYLLFNEKGDSYILENKNKLEEILLDVISDNPAKHLGKGETMIDQMLENFRLKGFSQALKSEIMEDILLTKESMKKDEKKELNK